MRTYVILSLLVTTSAAFAKTSAEKEDLLAQAICKVGMMGTAPMIQASPLLAAKIAVGKKVIEIRQDLADSDLVTKQNKIGTYTYERTHFAARIILTDSAGATDEVDIADCQYDKLIAVH